MGSGAHGGFGGTKGSSGSSQNMPNSNKAVTPIEKFTKYSLDYTNKNASGKAEAYEKGLGYTISNANMLRTQIHNAVSRGIVKPYEISKSQYGTKYKYRIPITGPNGKTKNVIAVYQIDAGSEQPRLITNYLEGK